MKDNRSHLRFYNIATFVVILVVSLISLMLGYLNLDLWVLLVIIAFMGIVGVFILSNLYSFILYSSDKNKRKQGQLTNLENLNHPLLERLSREAPGTYSHSLMVAQLSVSVGKKLNLNPTLLRVGSYYHDIGKLKHPNIYIENKKTTQGINSNLTEKDARTIVDHVSAGVKIARENKLPEEIIDSISQHHGTSSFFSIAYPGPKPLTPYSAILMLADGIEARIRATKNTSNESIQKTVHDEIEKRLKSDQLRLSGLTSADVRKIERIFFESARDVYHKRGIRK